MKMNSEGLELYKEFSPACVSLINVACYWLFICNPIDMCVLDHHRSQSSFTFWCFWKNEWCVTSKTGLEAKTLVEAISTMTITVTAELNSEWMLCYNCGFLLQKKCAARNRHIGGIWNYIGIFFSAPKWSISDSISQGT